MSDRREFHDLATPAEARSVIADLPLDPGVESVPLAEAHGRVLADRIDATVDVPGFDRASMDGYAVRAADTYGADEESPADLDLVGTVHAGVAPDLSIGDGEAAEISTGAVLPDGANAVVMVERTSLSDDGSRVAVGTSVAPGDHVMFAGADIAAGQRALGPGTRLTAREIGNLAALGVETVPVHARPRVGILSTGDELVRPGGSLDHGAGQIFDVNSYSIASAVRDAGGDPHLYPHAGDDPDELDRQLRDAAEECDLVLSSGSTSASAVDVVYRVVEERGDLLLHGVSVKPGKPMLVGTLGDSAYVGLPGYPVSALTVFRAFVAPRIRNAAHLPASRTPVVTGAMATQERYGEGRTRLMPVGLVEDGSDNVLVYPVDKGSGATTSLTLADGLVEVGPDVEYLAAGEPVDVELFSPDIQPPAVYAVGEDDPAFGRILDRVTGPRFDPAGSRAGVRGLRDGVPDVGIVAGLADALDDLTDTRVLAAWRREWGLVVSEDTDIEGLADLVDRSLVFRNRAGGTGLRVALDAALATLADDRGVHRRDLTDEIEGYGVGLHGHESPARAVARGDADVGLGLRASASALDLDFLALDTQPVRVVVTGDRAEKPGVENLEAVLRATLDAVCADLDGYAA
jgi:molybdenum cofactor synthesis domain-containing protein